jgi:sugar/nucleoside kinase (ribokinase family)
MINIAFTGCGLGDFIYKNVDFNSPAFLKYKSKTPGDGGLTPGKLVFTNELEKFAGKNISNILSEIRGLKVYDNFNIGGPALVSCICAAQLLNDKPVEIKYFGAIGNDEKGKVMLKMLEKLPVKTNNIQTFEAVTPYTNVLSDPNFNNGKGERTFINNIGAAAHLHKIHLNADFWYSDIVVFGGTAIVPKLHDDLTQLLVAANYKGSFTVVNTVFDFINEAKNPDKPWPLGDTTNSLPLIDLLIMDYEESKRISGELEFNFIIEFYKTNGANAFIITHGSEPTYIYSSGKSFEAVETFIPVCSWISEEFEQNPELRGDTTGCGDNFVGATIASVANQMLQNSGRFSLTDAALWGTVSGGFACYYTGGTFFEKYSGEKLEITNNMIERYLKSY